MKIGLLVLGLGLVLVVAVFVYALRTRVADVSAYPALAPYLRHPLPTARPATLFRVTSGLSTTRPIVLVDQESWPGEQVAALPVGTLLTFTRFLLVKNAVSGFTHVVGLGQVELPTGRTEFEYLWGNVDASTFTPARASLPLTTPVWKPLP